METVNALSTITINFIGQVSVSVYGSISHKQTDQI